MKYFLLSGIFLMFSISLLLGLPYILNNPKLAFTSKTVPNNQVFASNGQSNLGSEVLAPAQIIPSNKGLPIPSFTAASVFAEDIDLNYELYSKESDKVVPIASTTKIMTAIIAEKYYKQDSVLIVPNLPALGVTGSNMGLKVGEKINFRSLLYGMLLNSGNDAAFTIATNYPGGMNAFVDQMNLEATKLGAKHTHFDNPAGFDSPNHYSTASDLAIITKEAIINNQLSKVFDTKETTVTSEDGLIVHPLKNLNELLTKEGVIGVKTGYTPVAKENFVGLIEKNGHRVLTVVLGSDDRFGETNKLMDWIFDNFTW